MVVLVLIMSERREQQAHNLSVAGSSPVGPTTIRFFSSLWVAALKIVHCLFRTSKEKVAPPRGFPDSPGLGESLEPLTSRRACQSITLQLNRLSLYRLSHGGTRPHVPCRHNINVAVRQGISAEYFVETMNLLAQPDSDSR